MNYFRQKIKNIFARARKRDLILAGLLFFGLLALGQQAIVARADLLPILVNLGHLDFGTVFPGEELQKFFTVSLAPDYEGSPVEYSVTQKIKPRPEAQIPEGFSGTISEYCQASSTDYTRCYRDLCPFLTKTGEPGEEDIEAQAFVSLSDLSDIWTVNLTTPAIKGFVAQDHQNGLIDEAGDYGCDISIDVKTEGPACDNTYTYTLNNDFDLGTLTGLEHTTVADQLQVVKGEANTYPIMWVANAGEDTISKWDTNLNKELARYATWFGAPNAHGAWEGAAPSRTAVDAEGNGYVANRHFDGKPANVIKILANDWIDRNGNGVMDTSSDANSNGTIEPSEMLGLVDLNSNNVFEPNEITDERIAWVVTVGPNWGLGRSLAIDLNGNIWLGLYSARQYYKLSSTDGSILAGPIDVAPNTPYGALVDKHGILWGSSLGGYLLKLDTNTYAVKTYYEPYGDYGIALGYDGSDNTQVYLGGTGYTYSQFNSATETFSVPAAVNYYTLGIATDKDGNIVAGDNNNSGGAGKFAPNGSLIWQAPWQVNSEARGTVVDSNGDVWIIHVNSSKLSKFRGSDGAPLGVFNSGLYPYTYSDATGLGLRTSISVGTWNVVNDSGQASMIWNKLSWNANQPANTSLEVKVRSSEDQISWSPWEIVTSNTAFSSTPNGRYLEIQVTMQILSGDVSPILYDLTVWRLCNGQPVCGNGQIETGEQCDDENTASGDGCSSSCQSEQITPYCGDGKKNGEEECDGQDGIREGWHCTASCTLEANQGGNGEPNLVIVSETPGGGNGPIFEGSIAMIPQLISEAVPQAPSVTEEPGTGAGGAEGGQVLGESVKLPATGFNLKEFIFLAMIILAFWGVRILLQIYLKKQE